LRSRVLSAIDEAAERAGSAKTRELLTQFREQSGGEPTSAQVQGAIEAGRLAAETSRAEALASPATEERDPSTDPGGMTALLHAARQGHLDAPQALIEGGAEVNLTR